MLKNRLLDLKNKLINIDRRNSSLLLRRCLVRQHFDVGRLGAIEKALPDKVVASLLKFQPVTPVRPGHRGKAADELRHLLSTIKAEAEFIEAENGSYEVYLGWPFVEGTFPGGDYFRCPLLLVPVRLKTDAGRQEVEMEPDERRQVKLNRTFLLACFGNGGGRVKDDRVNELDAVPGMDGVALSSPAGIVQHVANLYANHGITLEIGGGAGGIAEMPNAPPSKDPKAAYPYRVLPHAVIGQFSQAAGAILSDYDELIRDPPQGGKLCEFIEGGKQGGNGKPNTPEREADRNYVCETDYSQEKTIEASRGGRDVLVSGPPGTGKSQVITNMVADNLARGRRVLIVCEKRAALDVAYRRLHKAGLSHLLQLVHDPAVDRDSVYEKARLMIEHYASGATSGVAADVEAANTEIARLQEKLGRYAAELHAMQECGSSLYGLYHMPGGGTKASFELEAVAQKFTHGDLQAFAEKAGRIIPLLRKYDHPGNPARHRKPMAAPGKGDAGRMLELSGTIARLSEKMAGQMRSASWLKPGAGAYGRVSGMRAALGSFAKGGLLGSVRGRIYGREEALSQLARDCGEEGNAGELREILRRGTASALEGASLKSARRAAEIFEIADNASQCLEAIGGLERFYTAELTGAWETQVRALQFPLHQADRLPRRPKDAEEMAALEGLLRECNGTESMLLKTGLEKMPSAGAGEIAAAIGKSLSRHWIDRAEERSPIMREMSGRAYEQARSQLAGLIARKARLVPRLISSAWAGRIASPALFNWGAACKGDAASLLSWLSDAHRNWLDWGKAKIISTARDEVVVGDGLRGARLARGRGGIWIEYASSMAPGGRVLGKPDLKEWLDCDFTGEGGGIIAHGRVPEYAGILHEVSKKRLRWTLRKFVSEFGSRGLFELFPVWLCSPETVSAIMPLREGFFDCVIFDEASQCPVERAAPSIHRAKTVAVAGDDKQLPPFDLFMRYYEPGDGTQEGDYDAADEIVQSESLLHGASRFQYAPLLWHYRSRHEPLIRFSNAAFYQNRLQTMPNAVRGASGFEWVAAGGTWEKRRNIAEAERIVAMVAQMLEPPLHPSIGIITFNSEQRDLIESRLDARARADAHFAVNFEREKFRKEDEELQHIFVKNIENVQGDERDVVIFSIAYAPGAEGGLKHQFGSLSALGGENRLNVAISRAKERVIVVASIEPGDLHVEDAANDGPKLFKKYLQYARASAGGNRKLADGIIESMAPPRVAEAGGGGAFEAEVAAELERLGYRVERRVGSSKCTVDLAVVDPHDGGRYALGIGLDGEGYAGAPSVNEREVYRPRFLESRGWNMYYIRSRDWWLDKAGVLKEIKAQIEKG